MGKERSAVMDLLRNIVNQENSLDISEEQIEDLKNIIFNDLVDVLLDDRIFDKREQKEKLLKLEEYWRAFEREIAYPWIWYKKKIVFAGRFSAGKSSLINSLLGEDLLPINVTPTTAVPSYITYVKDGINKFYAIEYTGEIKSLDRDRLKYFSHNNLKDLPIPLPYIIKFFIVPVDHEILLDTVIIDTPGYDPGQQKKWDEIRTIEAIKSADVIFWVVDIHDGGLSENSLKLLEKYSSGKDLYVVINKCDTKPPRSRTRVCEQIEEDLKFYKIDYGDVFLFSSKEPGDYKNNLQNIIKKLKPKTETYTVVSFAKRILKEAIDNIFKKQRLLTHEKMEKQKYLHNMVQERNNKLIQKFTELQDIIDDFVDQFIKADSKQKKLKKLVKFIRDFYSEKKEPIFDFDHYRIEPDKWEEIEEFVCDWVEVIIENENIEETEREATAEIEELEKILQKCRDIYKILEDKEEKFINKEVWS